MTGRLDTIRRTLAAFALLALTGAPLAGAQNVTDSDLDGIDDAQDNCTLAANPDQTDTDGDNYGNRCDADLNNDGIVNVLDLGLLRSLFFSTNELGDFNGDGIVNTIDLGMFKTMFFHGPGPSGVAATSVAISLTPVFANAGWSAPIAMRQAPGIPDRWYVLERTGELYGIDNDDSASSRWQVIDIPGVDTEFEGGALAFEFHPDFQNNGYLYVSFTVDGPNQFTAPLTSRVSRFETSYNGSGLLVADPDSELVVIAVDQPYANHNGGDLHFGPDGYLYWSLGDGGSGGDPLNNGQDTGTKLGSILRIDVNVTQAEIDQGVLYRIPPGNVFSGSSCAADACPEIFAYGLRNTWRFSFDSVKGDLWAGDVGQTSREEIDIIVSGGNYGWRCREGNVPYSSSAGCPPLSEFTPPVYDYIRSVGNSVTGGYVYRGSATPAFQGMYVFADYGSGEIMGIYNQDPVGVLLNTSLPIVSLAQGLDGELYATYFGFTGSGIRRINLAR